MTTTTNIASSHVSQLTQLAESSAPELVSGLHGNSDVLAVALGLEELQASLISGKSKPRFELRAELGVGGQGIVLSVFDRDCGRTQALKVLHEHRSDRDGIARFIHEAQVMAQLEHPGVVPIHDLNVLPDGTIYYSMKRVDGHSLSDVLKDYLTAERRIEGLQLFLKICDTMSFAHDKGVIHRDLKPANIMVGAYGEVLVVDWGLAKTLGGSEVISPRDVNESGDAFATRMGLAVGTPSYMSPEQARGLSEEVDQASDIFALGVILYELLSGQSPYHPQNLARPVMEAAARGQWRPIADVRGAKVPPALQAIVNKTMAYEKHLRYQSVNELAADIQAYIAGQAVSAYRESPFETLVRCGRRYRTPIWAVLATLSVGLLVVGAAWWRDQHLENERVYDLRTQAALAIAGNQLEDAVAAYQRLLEIRPDDGEAALGVGRYSALAERWVADRSAAEVRERNRQRALALAVEADDLLNTDGVDLALVVERLTQALALLPSQQDEARAEFLNKRDDVLRMIADRAAHEQRQLAAQLVTQAAGLVQEQSWIEARVALRQALQLAPANPQTAELDSQISAGLATIQEAQKQAAARQLLDEAQELRRLGDYNAAIAKVEAALALGQVESGADILAYLLREQDQQAQEIMRQRVLEEADREMAIITQSLTVQDIDRARDHYARLLALSDQTPELTRWRNFEEVRQKLDQAIVERQQQLAMGEVDEAQTRLQQADRIGLQIADLQRSILQAEEQLQQRPGDQTLRQQAHEQNQAVQTLLAQQSSFLSEAVVHLNRALVIAPTYPPVRSVLAKFWAQRVIELERSGDAPAAAAAVAQGQNYDNDGAYRLVFEGLSVVESTAATPLYLRRIQTQANRRDEAVDAVLRLDPGAQLEIPHGRWLLSAKEGIRAARLFERGSHYHLSFELSDRSVPDFMIYVPPTPLFELTGQKATVMMGNDRQDKVVDGFYLARFELTCGEYLEFLNDPATLRQIQQRDAGVLTLVPRLAWDSEEGLWAFSDGAFQLRRIGSGEAIDPRLPVTGISRMDVDAYLAWRSRRDGLSWRLPTGEEWQVAVQGGDGRLHPWGFLPDSAMCYSYLGAPTSTGQVELAVGSFPGDRSIHGIYDLAGSVAEFVEEAWYDHEGVSVARGGSFADREASRFTYAGVRAVDNRLPLNSVGFRLACDAQLP